MLNFEDLSAKQLAIILGAKSRIKECFGRDIAARGASLFSNSCVGDLTFKHNSSGIAITANVQGGSLYVSTVTISQERRSIGVISHCNCPYEYLCKHAAATLLSAAQAVENGGFTPLRDKNALRSLDNGAFRMDANRNPQVPAQPFYKPLTGAMTKWVENLDTLPSKPFKNTAIVENSPQKNPIPDRYVGFLMNPTSVDALSHAPSAFKFLLVALQKSSDQLATGNCWLLEWSTRRTFADHLKRGEIVFLPGDGELVSSTLFDIELSQQHRPALGSVHPNWNDSAGPGITGLPFESKIWGVQNEVTRDQLVNRAIDSGRVFYSKAPLHALKRGETLKAQLAWEVLALGGAQPTLTTVDPQFDILLMHTSAWYVDRVNYTIGTLDSNQENVSISQWLSAPHIPKAHKAAVKIELMQRNLPVVGLADDLDLEATAISGKKIVLTPTAVKLPSREQQSITVNADAIIDISNISSKIALHAIEVFFKYGSSWVAARDKQQIINGELGKRTLRSFLSEKRLLNELTALGLPNLSAAPHAHSVPTARLFAIPGRYYFDYEYYERYLNFVREYVPRLETAGWQVELSKELPEIVNQPADWYVNISDTQDFNSDSEDVTSKWFDVELGVTVGEKRYSLLKILQKLLANASLLNRLQSSLPDADSGDKSSTPMFHCIVGGVALQLPIERIKQLLTIITTLGEARNENGAIELNTLQAAELARQLDAGGVGVSIPAAVSNLRKRIKNCLTLESIPAPKMLNAELRPYQMRGTAWIRALTELGLGGILADDMGLGKTIQAIAAFLSLRESQQNIKPMLVVAPKGVLSNWCVELARFAPQLQVYLHTGSSRNLNSTAWQTADVIVTNYALLAKDSDKFENTKFSIAYFDEAQNIKNPLTVSYLAAVQVNAAVKFAVTGTPLENNLGDLWAQLNLVIPGYMGSRQQFAEWFRKPIEKEGNAFIKALLAERVRPFLLRRTKREVLPDLPPLISIEHFVDLEEDQADLYETIRLMMHKKIRQLLQLKGAAGSQIQFLDALLKLRQVCCDPQLVKLAAAKRVQKSAKREALMQLLETLHAEGRKVIIFSQFTAMLALIEANLAAKGWTYSLITGETRDRDGALNSFKNGEARILLMSLKAGGVGLNITAADTVILYDPWWNPAVEAQAAARAHRIGQIRPVHIYRLVTRGTIEEKIIALQARKNALIEGLLSEDDSHLQTFNEELMEQLIG